MKLLDVEAVLNRETDIQKTDPEREVLKELNDEDTRYAILSHRWGAEVGYEEMTGLMKMEGRKRDEVRQRAGYQKIIESCKQAKKGGYEWLWIDTCCIDKRSSAELSEAINSMYRWYQNAQVCYAYLNDVEESTFPTEQDNKFDKSNGWPEWFVRGWTLQELIAPKEVEFFNKDWVHIGDKWRLAPELERITGISRHVLTDGLSGIGLSVAQIMSWAADRKTTRVEDRAYSLMGLFGVNMPMLYGEGKKAFQRLQLEIIHISNDHSIFAWKPQMPRTGSVLAEDPGDFQDCDYIAREGSDEFIIGLGFECIRLEGPDPGSSHTGVDSRARHQHRLAAMRDAVNSRQFHTFTVNSAGIQVLLPVVPSRDSPSHFRAVLACRDSGDLVTIDLVSSGHSFARTAIDSLLPATCPEFKTLHLIHCQDTNETRREFTLEDKLASYHGFTRRSTYPRELTDSTAALSSLADDLVVIVYANDNAKSHFAVGLGYYLGQMWVHVVGYGRSPIQGDDWTDFGKTAYQLLWKDRAKHAQSMSEHRYSLVNRNDHFIKHAQLPRSIWAASIVWGRWEAGNSNIMVDIVQCPGCCDGPCALTIISNDPPGDLVMPELMKTVSCSHSVILDGREVLVDECSGQRIALGDYGSYRDGNLIRMGNIFEDMRTLGIDLEDPAYRPVVSRVSSSEFLTLPDHMKNVNDLAVIRQSSPMTLLALHQPKAISLLANEHVVLLLNSVLSTRLAGINKGTPTTINRGTTPSTDRQSPSTSVVHTAAASVLQQTPTRKRKLSESYGTDAGADDEAANTDTRKLRLQV
ncbi:heterokaryon incompatibility protein-domain-containing protein [Pisolithus thermaeus]|nr:heterokaryon incompatibility protein-domain-containing protein [Pisolithus thermaeus]